jgi:hypothetical protein
VFEYLKPRNGPVVDGLESQEVVYAAHQPQYMPLRTLCADGKMGAVLSRWTLTDEQRAAIASGADIFLELSTFYQPLQPIRMAISDASGDMFADWFKVCLLNQSVRPAIATQEAQATHITEAVQIPTSEASHG